MTESESSTSKVLVLCATGKCNFNVCRALKEDGFDVYGTTRGNTSKLESIGVTPIIADYTKRQDLDRALAESGAKKIVAITDFWTAAKQDHNLEVIHGKTAIDAAISAKVEHYVFIGIMDAERFPPECHHIFTKPLIEEYLKESGLNYSICRPTCFFENFDDAANYNPLKKGSLSFLTDKTMKFVATYDIGRAAAVMFRNPSDWYGKTLDIVSWKGNLQQAAKALERVGNVPVKYGLSVPIFVRKLFLKDLHYMCLFFEEHEGGFGTDENLKKIVPNPLSAEDWFRFHNKYADGKPIINDRDASPEKDKGFFVRLMNVLNSVIVNPFISG